MGSGHARGQAPAARSLPRTADGHPDIQGFWWADGIISLLGPETKKQDRFNSRRPGVIVDPPDGNLPYQPVAAERFKGIFARYDKFPVKPEDTDPLARCAPMGVPRVNKWVTPFEIVQPAGYVVFLYEYPKSLHRIVPLDGRAHLGKNIPLWLGDSRGHWEGNTLVVDITNTNALTWFDQVGNFHSDALHMVERLTMVDVDTIQYRVTLTDPKVYTRPVTLEWPLKRQKDEDQEFIVESECNEAGNPGLYGIMGIPHSQSTGPGRVGPK